MNHPEAIKLAKETFNTDYTLLKHFILLVMKSLTVYNPLACIRAYSYTSRNLNHIKITLKKKWNSNPIAVPNPASKDAEYYKEFWAAYDVPRHLYHFTPEALEKLLDRLIYITR